MYGLLSVTHPKSASELLKFEFSYAVIFVRCLGSFILIIISKMQQLTVNNLTNRTCKTTCSVQFVLHKV